MRSILSAVLLLTITINLPSCKHLYCGNGAAQVEERRAELVRSLQELTDSAPGIIGVAFVTDRDTIVINNDVHFAMMSVFKLHEAIAVAHALEQRDESLDKSFTIYLDSLNPNTWSPMLNDYTEKCFEISAADLIRYAVTQSDNNASNVLFKHVIDPSATDSYIKSIAVDTTFTIRYTEEQMQLNHDLSYENSSTPLSAALLIGKVFQESIVSHASSEVIRNALLATSTGQDRIALPLKAVIGAKIGHKTGSGYRNENGKLMAFNDVAYIILPNGKSYSLAIMIRDFAGSEKKAAHIMAEISSIILSYVKGE